MSLRRGPLNYIPGTWDGRVYHRLIITINRNVPVKKFLYSSTNGVDYEYIVQYHIRYIHVPGFLDQLYESYQEGCH